MQPDHATHTDRFIVTARDGDPCNLARALRRLGVRSTATTDGGDVMSTLDSSDAAVIVPMFGMAIVSAVRGRLARLTRRGCVVEREMIMHAMGWRSDVYADYRASRTEDGFRDARDQTWGLQAVGVRHSTPRGEGITVAVLDTGLDLQHADVDGRGWAGESFVVGESDLRDHHGHGTHCAGTVAGSFVGTGSYGPASADHRPHYGVAPGARILAGKVLSKQGTGTQGGILAGMEWAVKQGAQVISMSLGANVRRGESHSPAYERAAKAALDAGCLVVAAAGNSGEAGAVGSPANCPSVLAVAALDQRLQRARFSSRGYDNHPGPQVAAPGVDVLSSIPGGYAAWSGTSMATPHVAGVAAAWAASTGLRGRDLWRVLVENVRVLGGQSGEFVGVGLVQVPA